MGLWMTPGSISSLHSPNDNQLSAQELANLARSGGYLKKKKSSTASTVDYWSD